jgi:hypothetical protein
MVRQLEFSAHYQLQSKEALMPGAVLTMEQWLWLRLV